MVAALGGPRDVLGGGVAALPRAPVQRALLASRAGVIAAMDTRAIGLAIVALGGGRARASDAIDVRVGLAEIQPVGAAVERHQPLAVVHAASESMADAALARLAGTITIADTATAAPVVQAIIGADA